MENAKRGENIIKKLLKIIPAAAYLLVLLTPTGIAAAQSAGQGLEISPPLIEINVDPGKTVTTSIRIRNITKQEVVAKPQVNDFVAQGEEGQPKLLLNEKASEPSPYSINGWVSALDDLTIAPGEAKTESLTISVPQGASPGGHYGVVRFTAAAPGIDSTGVSLSASVGTLVLINVSGKVVQNAVISDFYITKNAKKGSFFQAGPITFVERLQNRGNTHFKPTGTVRVTNTFGKETGVVSINTKGGNVLPSSTRRFEQDFAKKHLFGRYTAQANIQYAGQNLTQSITFWVIPLKGTAIVLGLIIIAFVLLRMYVKQAVKKASKSSKNSSKK